ncbi:MAG: anti-sigma factor [Acidimicrobiales bacterium]|nr:anti-sigma factor [Acidimicrobiales bacterium]
MGRLTHQMLRRRIGPLVDGELSGRRRRAVRRHLARCDRCRQAAEFIKATRASLRRHHQGRRPSQAPPQLVAFAAAVPSIGEPTLGVDERTRGPDLI